MSDALAAASVPAASPAALPVSVPAVVPCVAEELFPPQPAFAGAEDFPPCFAEQKSESSDEERIFLLNKNAQRWLFSSAPLYADNTLAHHITKCKYYVIHFVLSYSFSVNIMGE